MNTEEIKRAQRRRFGEYVRQVREHQGWSIEQVATMAGLKTETIEKIEAGAFNVTLDVLSRMAEVMGTEVTIKNKE